MGHAGEPDEGLEIASDELRAVVRDDAWFDAGMLLQARWITISTSASFIASRISQWTMARL